MGIKKYDNFCNEEINWKKVAVGTALGASLLGGMTSCKKNKIETPIYMTINSQAFSLVSYKDDCISTNDEEINNSLVGKNNTSKKSKKYQINSGTYNFEYILDEITVFGKYTGQFTIVKNDEVSYNSDNKPITWNFYLFSTQPFLSQYKGFNQIPDSVVDIPNGKVIISMKREIIEK